MTEWASGSVPYVLGRLIGRVNQLPRDEFGPTYRLALEAAYRTVESLLHEELRLLGEPGQ